MKDFLPISKEEMEKRGYQEVDFVIVTGDAYVDHPSFGAAVIARVVEAHGYTIGVIAQPDWKNTRDISQLGRPRLGFLVTAGNIDSMVNHYSVTKKRRKTDVYTPGGVIGKRPDRATIVYCNLIRQVYKDIPIIIGGLEASLRRLGHYDYWSNAVKRSILLDSSADIISYGMGEKSIIEIADSLNAGIEVKDISFIKGTVVKAKSLEGVQDYLMLPSYTEIVKDKTSYAKSFKIQYDNTDFIKGKTLIEPYGEHEYVIQNPPMAPLTKEEFDEAYDLPYMRDYHPSYKEIGHISAIDEIKNSLISNRGCFGGCNFCALTFHQGRVVSARSHESIVKEAKQIIQDKEFKGYIHDVGGPTANFRQPSCKHQLEKGVCTNKQCLFPEPCSQLEVDHTDYLNLLRKLRKLEGVKKVFVRSGIRFDYLIYDQNDTFFRELCEHHISGQLKVAPEHVSAKVLNYMGKPKHSVYEKFKDKYIRMNQSVGKNQFLVPYLISSHPGSDIAAAIELAEYLRDIKFTPKQVQDFYPTPSTVSTCMYYTGLDPNTMEKVFVPKSSHEKAMQRALMQYKNPKNYHLVHEALIIGGREDLIGFDKKCLIRPRGSNVYTKQEPKVETKKKYKKKTIRNVHKKKK
jgi:uncharacterized radical SAM protein YgiQ